MIEYPMSRRDDDVDIYHGTLVSDPYRWLEEIDSAETQVWVGAQNELTFAYLDTIPQRDELRDRFRQLWDFPRESAPVRRGDWYFYSHNDGLQAQPTLYKRAVAGGEATVVLDPNTLSEDGTVAMMTQSFTKDGRLLAYSVAEAGSDWQVGRILDTETGEHLDDELHWIKFTPFAWAPDGESLYYSRYPAPDEFPNEPPSTHHRVFLHRLGTDQELDHLVYERSDAPDLGFNPLLTDDAELLALHVWQGTDTRNRLYYRRLDSDGEFVRLLDGFDAKYHLVGHRAGSLYLITDLDAPRGRLIAIDLDNPGREHWREVVPEGQDTMEFATIVADSLVTGFLHNAHHVVAIYDLDGGHIRDLELPAMGTVTEMSGKPSHRELFIGFQSFVHPPTVLRYDFDDDTLERVAESSVSIDPDSFTTSQTWAESLDGTPIPMFVTHRSDLILDGTAPTILYGYGGFDISMTPLYAPDRLGFIEAGGVFAVANLRGGGEFGQQWHRAGMLDKKQNVFDDFIAAAEHLITAGYTSSRNLGIYGRSNGGLLVAACLLQRPDLFGAVVGMVPVTDMLRYQNFTAGRYWIPEYGDATAGYEAFDFLFEYSPLHNVNSGVYPPTLITTGDSDDRVVPLHSYKFIAELQTAVGESGPALLRVDQRAGHGLGKPIAKLIDEAADIYAFFLHHLS
ncbi:MAG: prolyl oligopeptidase family serine peptidase [Acidimicrobiia bacterium]|nr:prolyl oligopeptidase family serine peptidase [Acidimicrobiia bacterium]MDX2467237.1 prolyl oligopeptidase family serine peptidase [Acidimicrobiia bacterium]